MSYVFNHFLPWIIESLVLLDFGEKAPYLCSQFGALLQACPHGET